MSGGKQHTFASLMGDVDFIEIPILQRDYAQGSPAAADIRDAFLTNLRDALTAQSAPLDLDFVYGSILGKDTKTLSVLDGQQRLTTLFLLHWYLALRNGELEDFRSRWVSTEENRSRFSYATRPNSAEFFDCLATRAFLSPTQGSISQALGDEKWFFDAWLMDPTVRSCCSMLDAFERYFGAGVGLYRKLVDDKLVTFHFLELQKFGLSDDLYIKMNARGKPLTPFENFKAWLAERVSARPWASEFSSNLDQKWTDLFWMLARREKALGNKSTFDDLFLRYFYIAAFFEACGSIKGTYWSASQADRDWVAKLRDVPAQIALRDLEGRQVLDEAVLAEVMDSLNYLAGSDGVDHVPLLQRVLVFRPEYDDLLRLHALIEFHRAPGVVALSPAERSTQFARWSRVTENLIRNSRVDDPSAAVQAVNGLTRLAGLADSLYEKLALGGQSGLGFSREQVEEEVRKASLIVNDASWESLLRSAEGHWYLQGRVGFILDLSSGPTSQPDKATFEKYSGAVTLALTRENLTSNSFVLQRALLSLYDFMPSAPGGNHTFCVPNGTAYRNRLENWLPVIQDARFRKLLDHFVEHGENALHHLIETNTATGWRAYIVANPALIEYSASRMVRRLGADVLLLTKTRLTGFYGELRSLALHHELHRRFRSGKLPGVQSVAYRFVYGDDWPELVVHADAEYRIQYRGSWHCFSAGLPVELPVAVAQLAAAYSA
jgi:hypothetical protein